MSNTFSFVGAVGRDAEVRYTASNQAVLNVTVACNVGYGDKQQTLWVRVALWRNSVDKLAPYLKKGQQCFISGELTQREYQANDGTTKTSLELNANILDLVGGKRESEGAQEQRPQQRPAKPAQQQHDNFGDPYDDSEIPF
jgi:single-strand DNA-binding protein